MSERLGGHKIGFIGLGHMGWPMACHLQNAGAEMWVWNRSEEKRRLAGECGMSVTDSPAEVAGAVGKGILCLNLTHAPVVSDLLGKLEPALAGGSCLVDFGTTGYAETLAFAQRAAQRGVDWIDAPVSGGEVGAKAASLTIFAGGEAAAFERVRPVLEVVGSRVTHLGPQGAGQVTKLANQLIVAQTIDAVAQALRLAELAGLDSARVREALRGGFAESRILELHGDRMVRRDFVPGGRSELQLKDVRLMCDLAGRVGLASTTLENSRQLWEHFVGEMGGADLDHSGLFRIYEQEAGTGR